MKSFPDSGGFLLPRDVFDVSMTHTHKSGRFKTGLVDKWN